MLNATESSDPSSNFLIWRNFSLKRNLTNFFLYLLILLFAFCGKEEKISTEPKLENKSLPLEESEAYFNKQESENESFIPSPSNPLSLKVSERLLEYKIYLTMKSNNILSSRQEILSIIQKESILKKMEISFFNDFQTLQVEILTPVSSLYPTLLELAKVGKLISEKVETVDWTEHNQKQKIALERENIRLTRRAKAGKEGSATNWTWKDREELLEKSENKYDEAKLETWKIQDSIRWAKIYIQIEGKEVPFQIQYPNFRNTFISSINFIFNAIDSIVWFLPLLIILALIYLLYKRYKNRY